MRHRTIRLCVALWLLAPGCMSMTRSPSQVLDIQTTPPGAKLTIRPVQGDFESPAKVSVSRKVRSTVNLPESSNASAAYIVTASKTGYRDAFVTIHSKISTDTWVRNLIWLHPVFFGLGVLVDVTSGAAYELRPSSILVVLEPQAQDATK